MAIAARKDSFTADQKSKEVNPFELAVGVDGAVVLDKQKIDHTWELVEGGGHAWGSGFKESSLTKSLTFVGKSFVDPKVTVPGDAKPAAGKRAAAPAATTAR